MRLRTVSLNQPGWTRRRAGKDFSGYLGNTTAIARNSYVDPRVLDLYEIGTTIAADRAARLRRAS